MKIRFNRATAVMATVAAFGISNAQSHNPFTLNPGEKMFAVPTAEKNPDGLAPYVPNTLLITFKAGVSRANMLATLKRNGLTNDATCNSPYFVRALMPASMARSGMTVGKMAKKLNAEPTVRVAEPDYLMHLMSVPNDPKFGSLWGLRNQGQTGGTAGADIDATLAWDLITGSNNVKVAVIDTGMDYTHPDLAANAAINTGEVPGNAIDDDGNGFVDDVYGWDFANNDNNPIDDNGHGSHCSGTIGGVGNNGIGVAGVCWNVKIFGCKFLSSGGSGSTSNAVLAIDYARIRGANIMSNSWGGGGASTALSDAIGRANAAGIAFIAAAGNSSSNNDTSANYPSNYNETWPNVIAVASTTDTDALSGFSSYGAVRVEIAAPGSDILSTVPVALDGDGTADGYDTYSGTSMATPHVAGASALLIAKYPGITVTGLKQRLQTGVEHPASLNGKVAWGRLNINNSMEDDSIAPSVPTGFVGLKRSLTSVIFQATASGDDGNSGAAALYELRYSKNPINAGNFASATLATGPAPRPAGSVMDFSVRNLSPTTPYYFAMRAVDNVGNTSGIVTAGPYSTLSNLATYDQEGAPMMTVNSGGWALSNVAPYSGVQSWTDSPAGTYANSIDISMQTTNAISVTGPSSLAVAIKYDLESNYDYLYVDLTADNGSTWTTLAKVTGASDWTLVRASLAPYVGQSIKLRFRMTTDGSVVREGVYIDDIAINPEIVLATDQFNTGGSFTSGGGWTLSNEKVFSPTMAWSDSVGGNYANDLELVLEQNASIATTAIANPTVRVVADLDLENNYDYLRILTSSDNGATYTEGASFTGTSAWTPRSAVAVDGNSVRVKFVMSTDYSVVKDGIHLDDFQIVGEPCEPISSGTTVSGVVTLPDVDPAGNTVTIEVRNGATVVETHNVTLGAGGSYSFSTAQTGTKNLSFSSSHYLRKNLNGVTMGSGSPSVALVNGDVDGSNNVDLSDYLLLSGAFDSTSSSSNWLASADLNEDGSVDLSDYLILVGNFDLSGDN